MICVLGCVLGWIRSWICGHERSIPPWKNVEKGLCFKGTCQNGKCIAHNKTVIYSHGYTDESGFVLENDGHKIKCPECNTCFDPKVWEFKNCRCKVEGKKFLGFAEGSRSVNEPYGNVDNAGKFKPVGSWLNLKLTAVPLGHVQAHDDTCISAE